MWGSLLNDSRRKYSQEKNSVNRFELRTELERDYDRILFSTPVRRLADKTQVFPLDKNDSVRNRLTHSHEVSNLARSLGVVIATKHAKNIKNSLRNIPSVLAAVGLVHDLGNPPFGHQGEAAIRKWFDKNKINFTNDFEDVDRYLYEDFLNFDGNAQTLRLVTRLQMLNDNFGIDLTYATLASLMKYTVNTKCIDKTRVSSKKHGYFFSEESIAKEIFNNVGLPLGNRHPLAYVMEACDDIAYATIDVEDSVKKGLVSFNDVISYLRNNCSNDKLVLSIIRRSIKKNKEYTASGLSPSELNDVSIQRFRVYVIGDFVKSVVESIKNNLEGLMSGSLDKSIIELSSANVLRECLGGISKKYAFNNRAVLELELNGFNVISELMGIFWFAIKSAHDKIDGKAGGVGKGEHPFARYVYSRISENYRRVFENPTEEDKKFPLSYRRFLLLTDMMSGMTDSFAINILNELRLYKSADVEIF